MRKLEDSQVSEIFGDVVKACADEDLEFIEAFALDENASDERDCINQLIFRSFNKDLDQLNFNKKIERFSDTEYAMFETKFIEDVLIIFAYI